MDDKILQRAPDWQFNAKDRSRRDPEPFTKLAALVLTLSPLKQIAVSARRDSRDVNEICLGILFVFGSKLTFYP